MRVFQRFVTVLAMASVWTVIWPVTSPTTSVVSAATADGVTQTQVTLDKAQRLIWNQRKKEAHQILWRIFINGEAHGATQLEIADAAYMLVRSFGAKDDKEYLYLTTWAAEAGHGDAMVLLARGIFADYDPKRREHLAKELAEYPSFVTEADALDHIQNAAGLGNAQALLLLSGFYEKGDKGFLADPFYAKDLRERGIEALIAEGRAGDHHKLIRAARLLYEQDKSGLRWQHLMSEAISQGQRQPGGLDIEAASHVAQFYGGYSFRGDETAQAIEFAWLFYAAQRVPPQQQRRYLERLAGFFGGDKSWSVTARDERVNVVDLVTAHGLYNALSTRPHTSHLAKQRDALAKLMTPEQMKAALQLARRCVEGAHATCLEAVGARYAALSGS